MDKTTGYNSTYKKLAAQWLNEALCFVSSAVLADSLVLRNPKLTPVRETLYASNGLSLILRRLFRLHGQFVLTFIG